MDLKVCIDLGSKFIKIIEGYEKKGKVLIRKIEKIENPIENFRKITDEEEIEILGNFLRDYLRKTETKSKLIQRLTIQTTRYIILTGKKQGGKKW